MASLSALVVDHSAVPASAAFIMVAMLCDGDTFYTADVVRCAVSRCPTHPSALLLAYPLTPTSYRKNLSIKPRKTRLKYQLKVLLKSNKSLLKYIFVNFV